MRKMRDSGIEWIGAIPQDWKTDRLQWHLKEINVSNNPIQTKNILSLTIEAGVIPYAEKGNQGNKAKEDYSQYKIAFPDTLVINSMNVIIGAVGISQYFGCISPVYYVFEPIEGTDLRYIYYLFTNTGFQKEMRKYAKGILEIRLRISSNDMLKRIVPSPPFKEQQRITDYLNKMCAEIDAVLEKTRASIEEYKKLKQAVITQAVTKGVRGDRPMKDSGIEWMGEIPAEWEIRKIFRAINKVGDIDHYMPDSVDDGIPYLMTGDLQEKLSDVNLKRCKKVSFQDYEMLSSKIRVSKGDVIFARYATIGTVCFVDTEDNILVSYACLIIKPNSSLLYGEFLFYYLKSTAFLEEIKQYIKANTQANVGLDSVSKAKIVLPSVHEQQKIVEYLRDKCKKIDALIAKKQQYLTEIENYKKSLIYEYVTGKKEVV